MFRIRMAWLASVIVAAMVAVMLLSVGGTAAKTPGWTFIDGFTGLTVTKTSPFTTSPPKVSPGAYAAFDVTIKNTGSSNISALYLKTDIPVTNPMGNPVYVFDAIWDGQSGPARPCDPYANAPLSCSFGALNSGASVTVEIVFTAPSATTTFNFVATGNGNTPSDSGGTSHGDSLLGPAKFTVDSSGDFAGGFTLNTNDISTSGSLTKRNPQSSSVTPPTTLIPVTVEDSSSYPGGTTDPLCNTSGVTCIGQWTDLHVNNGQSYPGGIRVVLTILGNTVPGYVSTDQIYVYHDGDGIIGDSPDERCDSATSPSHIPCVLVSKVGNNFQIIVWLLQNGGLHSAY